jgi:hypothetical protein
MNIENSNNLDDLMEFEDDSDFRGVIILAHESELSYICTILKC